MKRTTLFVRIFHISPCVFTQILSGRGEALSSERERTSCGDHIFCFWVLLLPLVVILSLRKLRGFLLYGFPEEKYVSLVSCNY